jgi:hypothetical protein
MDYDYPMSSSSDNAQLLKLEADLKDAEEQVEFNESLLSDAHTSLEAQSEHIEALCSMLMTLNKFQLIDLAANIYKKQDQLVEDIYTLLDEHWGEDLEPELEDLLDAYIMDD